MSAELPEDPSLAGPLERMSAQQRWTPYRTLRPPQADAVDAYIARHRAGRIRNASIPEADCIYRPFPNH